MARGLAGANARSDAQQNAEAQSGRGTNDPATLPEPISAYQRIASEGARDGRNWSWTKSTVTHWSAASRQPAPNTRAAAARSIPYSPIRVGVGSALRCCRLLFANPFVDLPPWQMPPCRINLNSALRQPYGDARGAREGGEILKKMLPLGLSRYEPNPLHALGEAERRTGP